MQCSKLLPVRLSEADIFGGGPVTFWKIFFNFMLMIWDSMQEDWQLFWLSLNTVTWGSQFSEINIKIHTLCYLQIVSIMLSLNVMK